MDQYDKNSNRMQLLIPSRLIVQQNSVMKEGKNKVKQQNGKKMDFIV